MSDKDTAQAFMRSTLDDAARVRGQYTRNLVISEVDSLPLVDYHAGDWITAPTITHGEKVRVQEIDLSMRRHQIRCLRPPGEEDQGHHRWRGIGWQ